MLVRARSTRAWAVIFTKPTKRRSACLKLPISCGREPARSALPALKEEMAITKNTQPLVFTVDLAIAEALRSRGVKADAVAGFSLGELAALTFAGAFTKEQGFALVQKRAALMQKAAEEHPGKMAAVLKLPFEKVEEICAQVGEMYPVNYNCPGQVSVAGAADRMDELVSRVKEAKGAR